jgi:hypothetical protein
MNASQLTMIKEAKRLLEDCSCFRGPEGPPGPTGPQGSTIVGPEGPPGTLSSFSIPNASTNALLYYANGSVYGMSSLFYYSTINLLQANLDIVPCTDNIYDIGYSNERWANIYAVNYNGIENYSYISTTGLSSTLRGLGSAGYISSSQLISTVTGLGDIYLSSINQSLASTTTGLATTGYISSSQLLSTVTGLGDIYLSSINQSLASTTLGLGSAGYISSSQLLSTVTGLGDIYLSSINQSLASTTLGLGTIGYISSSELQSTVKGLGNIYLSSLNTTITSTVTGLGNIYISSLDNFFPSTVTGLGNIYLSSVSTLVTSSVTSTVTGLGNIYLSTIPLIQSNITLGKVLRVDSVYGNDTTALQSQYTLPFSTISAAMYCASSLDQIWLLPGYYNERVIFKNGVNIRGGTLNSAVIQQLNVTQPTTLVTMGQSNRLEDVTLNLTSKTTTASTLIGVLFSSCQETSKLRTVVMNINNSALTDNTRPNYVYGIYSAGYSSTIYNANDNIQRTTMTVTSAGGGKAVCIYNDNSNRFTARDTNLFCTDSYNAVYTGGTYYGIETANSNSVIQIKSSSVNGNAYNVGNYAQDISQTKGQIIVGFTDLVNRTANNLSFTCVNEQVFYSFGVNGRLSNSNVFAGLGYNWNNSFLIPGTTTFSDFAGATTAITNYYPVRNANLSLLTSMGFQAASGPGAGISSFAVLYKNNIAQSQFVMSLTGTQSNYFISTSTLTLAATDTFGIYLSTSTSNTAMSYPLITMTLY